MEEKTNYHLSTSVSDNIVEIVITGELSRNALDKVRADVKSILWDTKAKAILVDSRDVKGPHEIVEAYFRARSVPPEMKIVPTAIVEPSEDKDFHSFYEVTASNTGLTLKFFTDVEAARAWLKSRLEGLRKE
jgi:hypothetical protein